VKAVLRIHVERADTPTTVAWWADSPDLPGLYAVGDTLTEMRAAAIAAIRDEFGDDVDLSERLAVDDNAETVAPTQVLVTA
jgi:predicted RNase H-like HicB family nuclease